MLWYTKPADPDRITEEGLPIGNGRLGGLVTGGSASDLLLLTDVSLWTGGRNDTLDADGQFSYDDIGFGTLSLLAGVTIELPDHDQVTDYRRVLDLTHGLVETSYTIGDVGYARRYFASRPDDVVVVRLTQSGEGSHSGRVRLSGRHGETTTSSDGDLLGFEAAFANGLRYAATVTVRADDGEVTVAADVITFTGCSALTVIIAGGTSYRLAEPFLDPGADVPADQRRLVDAAATLGPDALHDHHLDDYRALEDRFALDLGSSTDEQQALDTWSRLQRRAETGEPDAELEADYVRLARYLTICASRDHLPLNLQGVWLDRNDPDWMADYHTDINVQMNYWLTDRAGLTPLFEPFVDYCLAQLPSWTATTQAHFNDPRNRFANTSGRVSGWTVAFSTNPYGGLGWWWHPAGNAWLCHSLHEHYEFTADLEVLARIVPLLEGAVEFWLARLVPMIIDGEERLVDDHDWSPEHGPQDARGTAYAQELVHWLFGAYADAVGTLDLDDALAVRATAARAKLHLPQVSPVTGQLQEWLEPTDQTGVGEHEHRHLSPLVGLFPGDRLDPRTSPPELITAATALLTARGMESYGWACAWRAMCWARLGDAEKAYELVGINLRPSQHGTNGSSANLFDIYTFYDRSTFQIDANFGTPTAMIEMLVHSRPGLIDLLPALPAAWPTGSIRGVGARGGFTVDLSWADGAVTTATVRSVGGTATTVRAGGRSWDVRLPAGAAQVLVG